MLRPYLQTRPVGDPDRVWYVPHSGGYHPKKPGKIRLVFDSSATYDLVSLNKQLMSGPDSTNSMLRVLLRFRLENTAVSCDLEQMFHSFFVSPRDRNFRFRCYVSKDFGEGQKRELHALSDQLLKPSVKQHTCGPFPQSAVCTYN